jgi:hypothetical protein
VCPGVFICHHSSACETVSKDWHHTTLQLGYTLNGNIVLEGHARCLCANNFKSATIAMIVTSRQECILARRSLIAIRSINDLSELVMLEQLPPREENTVSLKYEKR